MAKFIDITGLSYFWTNKVKAYIATVKGGIDTQIQNINTSLASKVETSTFSPVANQVTTNKNNISNLSTTVSGHTTTIAGHTTSINTNTTNIGTLTTNLGALEVIVGGHTDDIGELGSLVGNRLESSKVQSSKTTSNDGLLVYNTTYINNLESSLGGVVTGAVQDLEGQISQKLNISDANDTFAKKTDIISIFEFRGSISATAIPTLSSVEEGWVYNVKDKFTINNNFIDFDQLGAVEYPGGTNIIAVKTTVNGNAKLMWEVIGGSVLIEAITNSEIDANISLT